jgi:hypothetical protein
MCYNSDDLPHDLSSITDRELSSKEIDENFTACRKLP